MPPLAGTFADKSDKAVRFACAIELAKERLGTPSGNKILNASKLEYAYELAYLRVFTSWEDFLEQSFLRYLCGYEARHGQEQLAGGSYSRDLSQARATLYGTKSYLLWHNPGIVIARARTYFQSSRHEIVIGSIQGRVEHYAAIRHRIAHAQAEIEFDRATMALAGRRFRGSRPGRFLRSWVQHSPYPLRWIDQILLDFRGLAFQIVPR